MGDPEDGSTDAPAPSEVPEEGSPRDDHGDGSGDADAEASGAVDAGPEPTGNAPAERVRELAAEAQTAREAFEPPAAPPDEERAVEFLREGFGPAVWVYVQGHTGDGTARFSETDLLLLRRTMNDWLELYARCYGVDLDAQFTVREAAELLIETRNVYDTAQLLTRIPER